MANVTRTFTVDELEEIGVTVMLALHDEIIEADDGMTLHSLVFEHDGHAWEVTYRHHDMEGVYWDDDTVTATAVEQREVTVAKWLPVEAPAEQAAHVPPPLGDDPDEWPIATSRRGLIAAVRTWLGDIAPGLLADLEHSPVHDAPDGVVYDQLPYSVDELVDRMKEEQR